jgi:hypothetical protein
MTFSPAAPPSSRNLPRSAAAIFSGLVTVVALSIGTDAAIGARAWMQGAWFLLALAYRSVWTVLGGYVAAKFAPRAPVRHAFILGVIGFVLALGGVAASLGDPTMGPIWYPVALVVLAVPCSWLGGVLAARS